MMFKHTKEPWARINAMVYALNSAGVNKFSATFHSVGRVAEASQEECEANARLAANAPQMLRTMFEMLKLIQNNARDNGQCPFCLDYDYETRMHHVACIECVIVQRLSAATGFDAATIREGGGFNELVAASRPEVKQPEREHDLCGEVQNLQTSVCELADTLQQTVKRLDQLAARLHATSTQVHAVQERMDVVEQRLNSEDPESTEESTEEVPF